MTDFEEILDKVVELLRQRGRISYRALKRQFDLDDDFIEDLKIELIRGRRLAADEDGVVLVWADGNGPVDGAKPGTDVDSGTVAPAPPTGATGAAEQSYAERRQLTVLFCDLVGSTSLSGEIDPEEYSELIHAYQSTCNQVIQNIEGYAARYLGDGLLVYFGYPAAREDDAQRAVLAALNIILAMAKLNARLETEQGRRLSVRVGIHTGLTVVGAIGGSDSLLDDMALGETLNIAARIQGVAQPDTVVVSAATHKLVQGYFAFDDLGPHPLKGVANPLQLYRVLGQSGARSRLDAAGVVGLTSFVGRDSELALLLERWEVCKSARGQCVLIGGEPGIGKSRLVRTFHEKIGNDGMTAIEFRCSAYGTNSPYFPIIDHLEKHLEFGNQENAQTRLDKIEGFVNDWSVPREEAVPLMAALLGVPVLERYPPLKQTAERIKQQTEALLTSWLLESAKRQPILTVWEDLHWADPSTLGLLSQIFQHAERARFFALMTHRPEFRHPWKNSSNLSQLFINRFGEAHVKSMVKQLTGGMDLPVAMLEQVRTRTDGVPLFVEEVTKHLLESGHFQEKDGRYELASPLPALAVPATLQDSLMARLDKMSSAKMLAQQGAAIGREFSYELIRAVSGLNDATLQQELNRLVDAELLYIEGLPPRMRYLFKHAMVQDVAYGSLLRTDRQQYHQRIAHALKSGFPDTVEVHPEILAHHYTEAGLGEQAIQCWLKAGESAIGRSAHIEAIGHLSKGLQLLETLPESDTHRSWEVAFQMQLGAPLSATKGYCASEVEHAYSRALVLCEEIGDIPQRFRALYGLCRLHTLRAEYVTAQSQGEELLKLYGLLQNPSFRIASNRALAATSFYMGKFTRSQEHVQAAVGPDSILPEGNTLIQDVYDVVDARVTCLSYGSWTSWMLGYPARARAMSEQAITLARALDHPFSIALALSFAAWLNQFLGDTERTRAHAESALALSVEQGFQFWIGWDEIMVGWARTRQSCDQDAIRMMREGLDHWRATGSNLGVAYFLSLLAEAYWSNGQRDQALGLLTEAQEFCERTEERWWQAELFRLQGELFWLQGDPVEAERFLLQGIELARRQQAKSLELRLASSLARLWQGCGAAAKARELLRPVFDSFTEGRDDGDLRDARKILGELGAPETGADT